jgi:hypothetical protein
MIIMPMSPERQREFDRLLRRERIGRMLEIAPPLVIGGGLLVGLMWLRTHGGPAWIGLTLGGAAARLDGEPPPAGTPAAEGDGLTAIGG